MSVQQIPYSALYVHASWHFFFFLQIVLDATLMHMLERFFRKLLFALFLFLLNLVYPCRYVGVCLGACSSECTYV